MRPDVFLIMADAFDKRQKAESSERWAIARRLSYLHYQAMGGGDFKEQELFPIIGWDKTETLKPSEPIVMTEEQKRWGEQIALRAKNGDSVRIHG
jgi:hypothetical protein